MWTGFAGNRSTCGAFVESLAINFGTCCFSASFEIDTHACAISQLCKGVASGSFWLALNSVDKAPTRILQQLSTAMLAVAQATRMRAAQASLEGDAILMRLNSGVLGDRPSAAFFITVGNHFDGQLPDSLAALFRPIIVQTTDFPHIMEVKLAANGFQRAAAVSKKADFAFHMLREHLPSTSHYNFSKARLMAVIDDVIKLKWQDPRQDEVKLLVVALSSRTSQIEPQDVQLFNDMIDTLSEDDAPPSEPTTRNALAKISRFWWDMSEFEPNVATVLHKGSPQAWKSQVMELFMAASTRNGVIAVGRTGTGKTSCIQALVHAMTRTLALNVESGGVETTCVFPNSLRLEALYGHFGSSTHGRLPEWSEGLIPAMFRRIADARNIKHSKPKTTMIVMDGAMDSHWVDSIACLLGDQRNLHLPTFEVLPAPELNTLIFECDELSTASPASVSQCGIVYFCNQAQAWW